MNKISGFLKRNLKIIIIFMVILFLGTIMLYWEGINVLLKYNYYAIDGPEGIETFWIVVGNVFGFETAYGIYSGFRVHIFWIVAIFAAFIYLNRKNGIIKYNIGRNKDFFKECWKKRFKYALIPAIHYIFMIIIIAIVANILGNNMNYNFNYTIREDNILYIFKDNKLILFIVEQSFSVLTSYILAILAILFLEAFGKLIGIINYFGIFFIASLITGIIESIFKLGIGTYAFLPTYYFAYSSHDAFDIHLLYPIPLTIVLILWLNSIIKKKEIN